METLRAYIASRHCGLCDWLGSVDVRVWADQAHTWICPGCGMEHEDLAGEERWWDRP